MSDPVQTTQQTSDAVTATGVLGHALVFLGAVAGLWRTVFGTKAERQDASERAAEIALKAAEHADERAERADEQTASHRVALGTCEEQLRAMRAENKARDEAHAEAFRLVREELDSLRAENKALREQTAWQLRAINRLLAGSTPPEGIHPDEVRAGVAAQEDTGP